LHRLAGRTLWLWVVWGLWTPAALAQALSVSPVKVALSGSTRSALVSVHNEHPEARRYQLKVFAWSQRADGEMALAPTKDVVVFPKLVTIGAGERRNLRVGTTTVPGATEKTYRVFIEELPPPARPGQSAVQVLTRIGVPVFVAPTAERVSTEVGTPTLKAGKLALELRNTGTVYVRPETIEAQALGARGEHLFSHRWPSWYVLAGDVRRYEVALPADVCGRVRTLSVRVVSAAGDKTQALATPSGACGP
jgi:fimbrial chaperone protein